jgi:hypothetical protein
VREDADKQCLFLKGIYYDLCLQLKGNNYASFQELVNKASVLDNERREMDKAPGTILVNVQILSIAFI